MSSINFPPQNIRIVFSIVLFPIYTQLHLHVISNCKYLAVISDMLRALYSIIYYYWKVDP